jgi:hypothetical protein
LRHAVLTQQCRSTGFTFAGVKRHYGQTVRAVTSDLFLAFAAVQ